MTISVVTPSRNRKTYLAATIDSVLGQRYPNLEYVVVDGGSTDGSAALIASHAGELAWWVSEPDDGPWQAINKGFAHTSGEVMGWLGSDDLLMPWALSVVGELFSRFPQIEWLTTAYPTACDEAGRVVFCTYRATYSREGFFRGQNLAEAGWPAADFIQQESTYWRRSLWERAGGQLNDSLAFAADFDLWARFHRAGATLYAVATPLAAFRMHGDQISSSARDGYIREARDVLTRHGGHPPNHAAALVRLALARGLPGRYRSRWPLSRIAPPQPICVHRGPELGWRIEDQ